MAANNIANTNIYIIAPIFHKTAKIQQTTKCKKLDCFRTFLIHSALYPCACTTGIYTFLRNGLQNVQVLVEEFGEKFAFKLHLHPLLGLQFVVILQHQVVELLQLGVLLEHLLPPPLPDTRHTAVKLTVPHPQKGKNIFTCMCMYCKCPVSYTHLTLPTT